MIAHYTAPGIDDATARDLQHLVQVSIDSRDACGDTADRLESASLKAVFERVARERGEQARVLQSVLWDYDLTTSDSRSLSSSLRGILSDLRAAVSDSPLTLLHEAIRSEEYIRQQYVDVLESARGRAIRQLLQEQLKVILRSSERIQFMRDICQENAT